MNVSRKYVYYEMICTVITAIVVTLLSYPCLEIAGENSLGGVGPSSWCFTTMDYGCATSWLGKILFTPCKLVKVICVGDGEGQCWDVTSACVAWNCVPSFNQACYE